jgi:chromate transporter
MRQVSMAHLIRMFAWIGFSSVGGGRSAYIYDMLVERHAWLTREEFLPRLTISQLLPGPNVANLAVCLGGWLRGSLGAIVALIAVIFPGAVTIIILAGLYFGYGVGPDTELALRGMGAAVVGFLCVTTARIGRGALRARGAIWIAGLTFISVGILRMNAFLVITLVGGLSLWLNRPGRSETRHSTGSEGRGIS